MPDTTDSYPSTRYLPVFRIMRVAIISFTLLRLILMARVWTVIDHTPMEWLYILGQGMIYDTAFAGYAAIPAVLVFLSLPNRWLNSRFFRFTTQAVGLCAIFAIYFSLVAEWLFWDEFGCRFNFISVDYLVYRSEVTNNILESYPVYRIVAILAVLALITFLRVQPSLVRPLAVRERFSRRLCIALCILLVPLSAALYLGQAQRSRSQNNYVNELASNGPYQLFAAFRNNTLDFKQFYQTGKDTDLSALLKQEVNGQRNGYSSPDTFNLFRHIQSSRPPVKRNVILISVESLSARFLTRFGEKNNLTPFLDNWFKEGLLFTRFYATGTRTTRGLEAITLSLPPTPGRSMVKRPDNEGMYSLGKVFRDQGYDTVFLYGGRGYFDNMNAFFSGNGYRTIDQTDMNDRDITFKNAWGVADEDLYRRAVREADQENGAHQPFFFHIMTTSNHRPYTYPEGEIDIPSGHGRDGAVKYTDHALERFMTLARTRPWFNNTLFVVVADHCASSAGKTGLPVEKYHIPFFIYGPGFVSPGEVDRLSSQIDIAPTLLALLHFSYDSFFFGNDILAPGYRERALIANYQKLGYLEGNELLILSPGKEISLVDPLPEGPRIRTIDATFPLVDRLMAYYQGADYILTHRLNRWSREKTHLALN